MKRGCVLGGKSFKRASHKSSRAINVDPLTSDHIMQKQTLYKHPHEHCGFRVFQKSIAGLTKHGL